MATARHEENNGKQDQLSSLFDLNLPGLEEAQKHSHNPVRFSDELLKYFRQRETVRHPVDRLDRSNALGKAASERDFEVANNALKHIFVGQSAYPPFFCGEDIDWGSRPVPDNEWVWQLNRMSFWEAMARVYWHTGDEKYALAWSRQLIDWVQKNPNDEGHRYAWRSIEAGIRGHNWTGLFQRFVDSPSFTSETLTALLNSLHDHASFLMTRYSTRSNWGLMEAEGLAFIAMIFPEFRDADKWRAEAFRRLNAEITIQVYPDGHQRELALGYHMGCINWFMRTYDMAAMNGMEREFPGSYIGMVEKMCEVPMKICHPDGTGPQFGDAWAGRPGQYRDRFKEWASRFNRDDFLFMASGGAEGREPDSTAFALPHSGIYSLRSGWGENDIHLVLKCGPDGGGHSQPDNGTFELFAGGRNLMPDAGSFIYSGDPEGRRWFRQTKVHQTLTLNGENSKYAPRLLLWQPGEKLDILVVENQSYENLTHRRAVLFVDKKYFVVLDQASGSAIGDVSIHFQLAPGGVVFNSDHSSVCSNFTDGWNILVRPMAQPELKLIEEEGWVSFQYTKKEVRPAFRYSLRKDQTGVTISFVTLVIPYSENAPDISVKKSTVHRDKVSLEILENGIIKEIGYELKN